MISRVIVAKGLLAGFRKQALAAYPNEVMNTLWGRIEGDSAIISSLRAVPQRASAASVSSEARDELAPAGTTSERYLGTIHSHPDSTDATPSLTDWKGAFDSGEHIFGVMKVEKRGEKFHTEVGWWEPRPMIVMIHPRVRTAKVGTAISKSTESIQSETTRKGPLHRLPESVKSEE